MSLDFAAIYLKYRRVVLARPVDALLNMEMYESFARL